MSRVLIVEDEKSMRELLTLILRKERYDVESAESATRAKERLTGGETFDLIISDISMPGMTGLELLRHCREACPQTAVILMTAYGTKQTAIDALNDGASYYVEKPFDLDEMKVVVRKTLEQKRVVKENEGLKVMNRDLRAELSGKVLHP